MSKIGKLFKKFRKHKDEDDATDEAIDIHQDIYDEYADEYDEYDELFESSHGLDNDNGIDDEDADQTDINTLDLEHGKIPLKDKVLDAIETMKASFDQFKLSKPKKMSLGQSDTSSDISGIGKKSKLYDYLLTINWKNIHNEILSHNNRQIIHKTFQFLFIFFCLYTLGKVFALVLKGQNDYKHFSRNSIIQFDNSRELNSQKINQLKQANLFKTQLQEASNLQPVKKPTIGLNIACTKAERKSSLPIKLINTVVLQDSVKSIASIQIRNNSDVVEFRQGDKINDLAVLDRVDRLKLIVKNLKTGNCESIENEDGDLRQSTPINVLSPVASRSFKKRQQKIKGIQNEGNNFVIDKTLINEKLQNINDILTQARGIQLTNPDGTLSFKIVDIQPGGIFSYLGVEDGDIITQINGQPINDLNTIMNLFSNITSMDKLNLTINRGGTQTPLDYKFK